MPIVSRFLKFYRVQASGRSRVREVHVDDLGTEITRQYVTDKSQVDVEVDMNARDLTQTLVDRDVSEVIQHVEAGNDISTFDYTGRDITEDEAEEEVLKEFARRDGESAVILSWWPEDLGTPQWNQLINRLGWDSSLEQRVQDRSIALNVARPFYDQTEQV